MENIARRIEKLSFRALCSLVGASLLLPSLSMAQPEGKQDRFWGMEGAMRADGEIREAILLGSDGSQKPIRYKDHDGVAVVGGDILIHVDDHGYAAYDAGDLDPSTWATKSAVRTTPIRHWPGNRVPYVVDTSSLNSTKRSWVTWAIDHFHANTNLRFVERTDENYYVNFTDGNACNSYVGRQTSMSGQPINIGDCTKKGSVAHEIGHAVGLFHEHTRQDRDQHVEIKWNRIESSVVSNFEQYDPDTGIDHGDYDFFSIMHYGCWAGSKNGKKTIKLVVGQDGACSSGAVGQRDGLSDGDIEGLDYLYPDLVMYDNSDESHVGPTFARGFYKVGSWSTLTSASGYQLDDYEWLAAGASGAASWSFEVEESGYYRLSARWPDDSSLASDVTYLPEWWNGVIGGATETIEYDPIVADQSTNGGQDNTLGVFYLEAGYQGTPGVFFVFAVGSANGPVVADSMTLERVTQNSGTFYSRSTEDGYLLESSENSNVGGSIHSTGSGGYSLRVGDDASDRQYKSIVSFDTSSIQDDATIVSATLRLAPGSVYGTDPFDSFGACEIDISAGGFGDSTSLQASDFEAVATASNVGTLSAAGIAELDAAGLAAFALDGVTQLRLQLATGDNDDQDMDLRGFLSAEASVFEPFTQWTRLEVVWFE